MKKPSSILLLILTTALIVTKLSADPLPQKTSREVKEVREILVGKTLLGKWKLTDDSNFRINSQTTMIN